MLIYETSNSNNLLISLDIITIVTTYTENFNITNDNWEQIADDISNIICSFGYYVVEKYKSDRSSSLYFRFCNDDELNDTEVTLIIGLRVSDHILPLWDSDKSIKDAEQRQLNKLKSFAHNNKWLNKNLSDEEEIPVEQVYLKYENEFYTSEEDVYNKIRQKIETFTNKRR